MASCSLQKRIQLHLDVRDREEHFNPYVRLVLRLLHTAEPDVTAVGQIYDLLPCSPSTVKHYFTREVGVSIGEYLRTVTLVRSLGLLARYPEISLADVSCLVGYSQTSSLVRVWNSMVGYPPGWAARRLRRRAVEVPPGDSSLVELARYLDAQAASRTIPPPLRSCILEATT
jgi:transcriptional regulator GlxA family with amidase domain